MVETDVNKDSALEKSSAQPRRALIIGKAKDAGIARDTLSAGNFEALCAPPGNATRAAADFSPAVVLFAFGEREDESEMVAAARRIRLLPETVSLPLVFLFRFDERALRNAAFNLGADDYFALSTPVAEASARLDSLFWRAEAGRRAALLVRDQLSEIDNFLLLLDAIGRDLQEGRHGTVGLVGLAGDCAKANESDQERSLTGAHGYLKLNLRRVDAVAFYGPTILLTYLPRTDAATARAEMSRLRAEFIAERHQLDIAAGLASFPSSNDKVESLVEKAEIALGAARADGATERIKDYSAGERFASPESRHSRALGEPEAVESPDRGIVESRARAAKPERPTSSAHGSGRESATGAPRRLLLAVSNAARMAQVNLLLRSAGYEVRAAFDGQQALNLLRIERPDLVLVDYELDDMNGLEMLERFQKQAGGKSRAPVVLMVPARHTDVSPEAERAGAKAVLGLPYDPVELLNVVRVTSGTN